MPLAHEGKVLPALERQMALLESLKLPKDIVAAAHPLSLHGFDPLNVSLVAKGEILHRRYLELGDKESSLKVLDAQVLTEAAGEHPLFNGVKELRMTGLAAEPKVVFKYFKPSERK